MYRPIHHHGEQLSSIERARSASLREPNHTSTMEKASSIEQDEKKGRACVVNITNVKVFEINIDMSKMHNPFLFKVWMSLLYI